MRVLFLFLPAEYIYRKVPGSSGWLTRRYKNLQMTLLNPRSPEEVMVSSMAVAERELPAEKKDLICTREVSSRLPEEVRGRFREVHGIEAEKGDMKRLMLEKAVHLDGNRRYDAVVLLFCDPLGCGWRPLDREIVRAMGGRVYAINGRRRFSPVTASYLGKLYRHRIYRKYPVFQPVCALCLVLLLPVIAITAIGLLLSGKYHYG